MNRKTKMSVGGQAVIEGVMMKSNEKISMSVKIKDGSIDNECWEDKNSNKWFTKVPVIRGFINFISMMVLGYKCLIKSAEKNETVQDSEKLNKPSKLENVLGNNIFNLAMSLSMVFGIVMSIFLFMWVPSFIVKLLENIVVIPDIYKSLLEGFIKVLIFIFYITLTSFMEDMKTLYRYHGAEHKSIACYESGDELTVGNVRRYSRFHSRCGTSFILITLVVGILVFSFISWSSVWVRVLMKLGLMPLVIGFSYEIIKFTSKHENKFTKIFILPGLWLQRITTEEPNDTQIEVAIDALRHIVD